MSESKFSKNSSSLWLYETTISGKATQISDLGETETKSLVNTDLSSLSDDGKEAQKLDLGRPEIILLGNSNQNSWSVEGKEAKKLELGRSEIILLGNSNQNSWSVQGKEAQKLDFGISEIISLGNGKDEGKETKESDLGISCSNLFRTVTQLNWRGESYNVSIDCDSREWKMLIMVEDKVAVNVEHLVWNFRGIEIFDGGPVKFEVVWNVKDWLFDKPMMGEAIFVFRNLNPTSPSLANIADFSDASDIPGYPLLVYAWQQEDQIE